MNATTKESHATTNAGYAFNVRKIDTNKAIVLLRNTGSKSAKCQLQGSINGTDYTNIGSEETVGSGASKVISVSDYWPQLRVVAKPAVEGEQTTVWVETASSAT
jgi:hypothetical protein